MKIRLAGPIQSDSIVDGEGIRTVIWTQGCPHKCVGCHNPETHSFDGGIELDVEDVKKQIDKLEIQDGITFSGGDPMNQVKACLEIAKHCRKKGLNIWCYTGYTFEQLMILGKKNPDIIEFLNLIDVLVDGRFILEERSLNLKFRGSRNQRIIDVKKSLKAMRPVCIRQYKGEKKNVLPKKEKYLFV